MNSSKLKFLKLSYNENSVKIQQMNDFFAVLEKCDKLEILEVYCSGCGLNQLSFLRYWANLEYKDKLKKIHFDFSKNHFLFNNMGLDLQFLVNLGNLEYFAFFMSGNWIEIREIRGFKQIFSSFQKIQFISLDFSYCNIKDFGDLFSALGNAGGNFDNLRSFELELQYSTYFEEIDGEG